jgi:hypothetical protein
VAKKARKQTTDQASKSNQGLSVQPSSQATNQPSNQPAQEVQQGRPTSSAAPAHSSQWLLQPAHTLLVPRLVGTQSSNRGRCQYNLQSGKATMGNSAGSGVSFTLGDVAVESSADGWTIYDAVSKSDKSAISVFKHTAGTDARANDVAANAFAMMKKLRHPYILKYQDGRQVGKDTFVATERVVPLMEWIAKARKEETKERLEAAVTWGIYCIGQALSFVTKDCKYVHGNVCPESIYVTRGGDWVLGGLGLVAQGCTRLKDFSVSVVFVAIYCHCIGFACPMCNYII